MNARNIALVVAALVVGGLCVFGQTGGVAERSIAGRYQLQSGSVIVDFDGTMRPTVFKLDTWTGDVEFLVPQPMPGSNNKTVVQSWAATIRGEAYLKMLGDGK